MLQNVGKRVYLIDEYRTSQCCPACERRSLKTFRMVNNPRPHRRIANPRLIRHRLLRYVKFHLLITFLSNNFFFIPVTDIQIKIVEP